MGPQAACSLQETEGTLLGGNKAGCWERDGKRVRAPARWGAAELSVVPTQQAPDEECYGRAAMVWGNDVPVGAFSDGAFS